MNEFYQLRFIQYDLDADEWSIKVTQPLDLYVNYGIEQLHFTQTIKFFHYL